MTDDKLAVSQEAREDLRRLARSIEIRVRLGELTREHLDEAFAQARLAGERAGMEPLDALAKHTNWELTHGGWEDEEQVWKVHSVNGGRNDREWTLLGAGETPAEAIRAAILKEAASITPTTPGGSNG